MFEGNDPLATLVEFSTSVTKEPLKRLELNQLGATRTGGRIDELLQDVNNLGIETKQIKKDKLSEFKKEDYNFEYRLISGNY